MQAKKKCNGKYHCDKMDWHLRIGRIVIKNTYTLTLTGDSFNEEVTLRYCLWCGGNLRRKRK